MKGSFTRNFSVAISSSSFFLHISDCSSVAQCLLQPITGLRRWRCSRGSGAEWVAGSHSQPLRAEAQPEPSFLPRFFLLDLIPKCSPFHAPQFSALEPASWWVRHPGSQAWPPDGRISGSAHQCTSSRPKATGPQQDPGTPLHPPGDKHKPLDNHNSAASYTRT